MAGMLVNMGQCPFCNSGKNTPCFATYTDGYHCYTCGKHKHASENEYAFKPIISHAPKELGQVTTDYCKFSYTVLQWLYKYYVFEELIAKYGVGYMPATELQEESLIFSFCDKEIFWQQRFFPSKRFKTGGSKNQIFTIKHPTSKYFIIVEDFISAIRVGEHTNILCLWGTSLNNILSTFLSKLYQETIIWLDPDDAGKNASKVIFNKLCKYKEERAKNRAFAVREPQTISILETGKQPKEYCDEEIKQIIGE